MFEDGVLKPLNPVDILREHERAVVILCPEAPGQSLREFRGTLSVEEAEQMNHIIEEEFEGIEGEW